MSKNANYNPFGPRPVAPPAAVTVTGSNASIQTPPLIHDYNSYSAKEKWILAAILSVFGGGIAYLLYARRARAAIQQTQTRAPVKQSSSPSTVESEFPHIQDLPPEIRTRIWQALPYEDVLTLRLTSNFIKSDVDSFVGLCGKISSSDTQKYDFYQNVALQSCRITELEHPITRDFLFNPNVLQSLEIREHSPIPLENIRAILSVSINLKWLKLRLTLNGNTQEISRMVLEYLPEMKSLAYLYLKTALRMMPEMKNVVPNISRPTSLPKRIKTIFLEMPDLSPEQMSHWKNVLDRQTRVESLSCNMGNVNWRLYEQVLRQNYSSLERVALEGLRGWDMNMEAEDPFDWSVFSNFVKLKSIDLCSNRGGDHDLMDSVNFDTFPCYNITEFFVSRIVLPPDGVDRVYTEMINLHRGALDHIGTLGIERANEMAWLIQEADGGGRGSWWQDERLWDIMAHGIFGVTLAIFLSYVIRNRPHERISFANAKSLNGWQPPKLDNGSMPETEDG